MLLSLCLIALAQTLPKLTIEPQSVHLHGGGSARQVLVLFHAADGTSRDVTHEAEFTANTLVSVEAGHLRPTANGDGKVSIRYGKMTAELPVKVTEATTYGPVGFRREVMAAMNVGGCNMGACHGTPTGKNGFKLSLRGFDPPADHRQLTRDQLGRRIDPWNPDDSLMLRKALGTVPHEGGSRFGATSVPANAMRAWIAAGLPDDSPNLAGVKRLLVRTGPRVLHAPSKVMQVAVSAEFADGTTRDVTRLTNFSSSDTLTANVNGNGRVEFGKSGEAAILVRYLEELVSIRVTYLEPKPGLIFNAPTPVNFVDETVTAKLKALSIPPSGDCTDTDFLRRVTLDVLGRLPTLKEVDTFLADAASDKRTRVIDRLLAAPEFNDFWAMKWADVLRSSAKTLQPKGNAAFQLWLRDRLAAGTPMDLIAQELLAATGNTYTQPAANFYRTARTPTDLAESTAQLFLGVRMQCAKCHNHPAEKWSQDDYYGLAAVFARVAPRADLAGAEVVVALRQGEVNQPRTGQVMKPRFPGTGEVEVPAGVDRRKQFADWLTKPGNPFFAKSVANRVWFHLLGRGIVEPVDDFRESNPAANDELLQALADDFAKQGFDLRKLIRTVLVSRTYQRSAEANAWNADDGKYFSRAIAKQLTAEQLLDAVCDVTGVPEKFPGQPAGTRAVQLPDAAEAHPFLKTFGKPARDIPCECERESEGNLSQALQLINGETVNAKLKKPDNRLGELLIRKVPDRVRIDELYRIALARPASDAEAKVALAYLAKKAESPRKAWEDVLWALLNTREFLYRH